MRYINGSVAPLMPITGYFMSKDEPMTWIEGNLANWNAYFTLQGYGEVVFRDATVRTGAGDFLLLAPGVDRSYRIPEPKAGWEFYWLHFCATERLAANLDWFNPSIRWQIHAIGENKLRVVVAEALEQAHKLNLTNPDLKLREPILKAMLEAIVLQIAAGSEKIATHCVDTRVERALELFHHDIAKPINVAAMSRKAGLSRSQFNLLFRRGTGRSPQQYIEDRRLEIAAYSLKTTSLSVGDVATKVGFESPFYFSLRFKKRFGTSPSAFRTSHE
jgi:AraC family transcriptional regulator, arabinose operon regulatory protein